VLKLLLRYGIFSPNAGETRIRNSEMVDGNATPAHVDKHCDRPSGLVVSRRTSTGCCINFPEFLQPRARGHQYGRTGRGRFPFSEVFRIAVATISLFGAEL